MLDEPQAKGILHYDKVEYHINSVGYILQSF